jgi:DNA-binding transcriptional LysR family regulator
MSQSAASKMLAEIEAVAGASLFERFARCLISFVIQLTPTQNSGNPVFIGTS